MHVADEIPLRSQMLSVRPHQIACTDCSMPGMFPLSNATTIPSQDSAVIPMRSMNTRKVQVFLHLDSLKGQLLLNNVALTVNHTE